ncbi:MAG: quinohemoprotein amine dehydrogenase subunit alpha [Gemmatimonadota bacterium]|nr:quinohemoprotein amine dehydrogenase subunit alpha [Gemmatimonadota bacterium]
MKPLTIQAPAALAAVLVMAAAGQAQEAEETTGIPVTDQLVIESCDRCHAVGDDGMMTRVSYMRKTPEGWQQSIRRMVTLNEVELEPEIARDIVRYLSDHHGIAPEELRPARFEVERRLIDWSYEASHEGDEDVDRVCSSCHSMGRVVTQRRTREEWDLLMATHRGYYPLSDTQGFRRFGPPAPDATDTRHPMDKAVAELSGKFPLETAEWSSWSATMRPPRLAGTWALKGHDPGRGPIYGTMEIMEDADAANFTTRVRYSYARTGEQVEREGRAIVYTGYQWRGRSFVGGDEDTSLREVMMVERGWNEINGRWFAGAYDEFGPDVTLLRADGPVVLGLHPVALRSGDSGTVTVHGVNLPTGLGAADLDLGPGVEVVSVTRSDSEVVAAQVTASGDAAAGARDVFLAGRPVPGQLTVYETVDRILVTPEAGMSRLGGGAFPKGYAQFEATAYSNGPDGEPETDDDLDLGFVDVEWSMEEYSAVFDDDDIGYVGTLGADGLFDPALDGPNPDRQGLRNNVGDVWTVATWRGPDGEEVRGRAHLIVTVPLYMRWEPWRVQMVPGVPRRTSDTGSER